MLEQLVEKLTLSQNYFSTAPGNFLGFRSYREGNKFFFELPEKIQCFDIDDGRTHLLEKNWNENDWRLYRLLYVKAFNENLFRIDVPLAQQTTDIHGNVWQYTKVMRPGLANGQFNADAWVIDAQTSINSYYETMIDSVYNLLLAANTIADQENNGLIPMFSAKRGIDEDGYYFIKTFGAWNYSMPVVINKLIEHYTFNTNNPYLTQEYKNEWAQRARARWETLL